MASSKHNPDADWQIETHLIHTGTQRSPYGETSDALYLTSGFVYESAEQAKQRFAGGSPGFIYSRFANPTVSALEERMRVLEGAQACRAVSSGMAAVTASMLCFLSAGDHVVAARALFGSCRFIVEELLPRFGITSTLIDGRDLDRWRDAIRPETKAFFFETPANPTLELIDIAGVSEIAKPHGIKVIVDNVFATPVLQKPLKHGADIVIYSATKHIDGQGRCLGGIILGPQDWVDDHLHNFLRQTGPAMSPFNAWVMLKSLETLSLRIERHVASAHELANDLTSNDKIEKVIYPGRDDHPQKAIAQKQMASGGNMIAFDIKGGEPEAFRFLNALEIVRISNNLGDATSLITHPATTTHQRLPEEARVELGIGESLLRLSVGLENVKDLKNDIFQALERA